MKSEIDLVNKRGKDQQLIRWFDKWGYRKWQYVFLHQLPVFAIWNVYWFFSDHNLSFYPVIGTNILQAIVRELPVLLVGIVFWTVMKIRNWNINAFKVGILNKKGKFHVEGTYHLDSIRDHAQSRLEYLSTWHKRWGNSKVLFHVVYTILLTLVILFVVVIIKMWQKGNTWINSFYPSEWPVYILLIGLPIVIALFATMEIWRQNEEDYLNSFQFQSLGKE